MIFHPSPKTLYIIANVCKHFCAGHPCFSLISSSLAPGPWVECLFHQLWKSDMTIQTALTNKMYPSMWLPLKPVIFLPSLFPLPSWLKKPVWRCTLGYPASLSRAPWPGDNGAYSDWTGDLWVYHMFTHVKGWDGYECSWCCGTGLSLPFKERLSGFPHYFLSCTYVRMFSVSLTSHIIKCKNDNKNVDHYPYLQVAFNWLYFTLSIWWSLSDFILQSC